MTPDLAAGYASAQGKRSQNEDGVYTNAGAGVFLVADGTGGAAGGRTAATIVSDVVGTDLAGALPKSRDVPQLLRRTLAHAHERVVAQQTTPQLRAMSSTAVILAFRDDQLHVAHVGDSRAYLWRDGELACLTRDHSWANHLADHPEVAPRADRPGSMLMQAVGMPGGPPTPDVCIEQLAPGDVVLACSDGISTPIPEWVLAGMLAGAGVRTEQEIADALVRVGLAHGSVDNLSAVVVRVGERPQTAALGWLAFVDGPRLGQVAALGLTSTLGSDPKCDVVVEDAFVSPVHVEVRTTADGGFVIKDLGSKNGLFVNEQRIREEPLVDGDAVRLGGTTLVFKSYRGA